jgi:hypothetical protein
MSTKARNYVFPRRNERRNPAAVRLGNCLMCGVAGLIGQRCAAGCREDDDLASEIDGTPVPNDLNRSRDRCLYKAMVMPDGMTVILAPWYEGLVNGSDPEGEVIDRTRLSTRTPRVVLERGCIHHRTIMAVAESAGVVFPPGNEIGNALDPEVDLDV